MVYHLMFGPEFAAACPLLIDADGLTLVGDLANHDVMPMAVLRVHLPSCRPTRTGWAGHSRASSFTSDFNFDFSVYFTEDQQRAGGVEYNFRREEPMRQPALKDSRRCLRCQFQELDVPTSSASVRVEHVRCSEAGAVYHTYSA